ncbi:ABC transporter permease [Conexibacter sp. SYSU D00693]|uniref:MlaE family ABC transporter permease n=1 Tax=Conexibacter sp. SYSU D00693 TaxID=2812560 RepID=UPI001F11C3D9|nr:ABC transporter permease [Conexibacter sp. SYSU D00693]
MSAEPTVPRGFEVAVPAPRAPAPRRLRSPGEGRLWHVLEELAGMVDLGLRAMRTAVTPPYSWTGEFLREAYLTLVRCLIPVTISTLAFGFGNAGVQPNNLLNIFGSVDRSGAFLVAASVREFAPWVNAMVLAGVAGTAICADLGARKARDELDALAVMGVDAVRSLVVPRFLALGVVTALMNMVAVLSGILGALFATVVVFQEPAAGFVSTFTSNFSLPDLLGSAIKCSLFGFIIAVVCCYKGMTVRGGPEGVGRAVNQAVVIAFAGIWVVNFMFTALLLGAFPETGNLH